MNVVDVRIVFVIYVLLILLCTIVMASLWWQNRKRSPETGLWLADYILQFVAILFITFRGILPDLISVILAHVMIIGGTIIIYIGLGRYVGRESRQWHNYLMLAVFTFVHAYFTYVYPDIELRTVNSSVALIFICSQCSWLMLRGIKQELRSASLATGIVFGLFCLVSIVQIAVNLTTPRTNDLFVTGFVNLFAIITFQILFIALTFSLFLLVSRRLSTDLEKERIQREQEEKIIRLRLSLLEFATTHSLDEVLQKTLDDVGNLVESPIGFYHFVEEDQKTLSLQAWSTRTAKEFCKAEGKGMHYDIDQAGVWVDCVYQKRAVIHNDYLSLPHRKGMPEGHAAVVRELVVPIMRGGNVMAILGVGNKPSDYNEKDVDLVSYLADVAWEITRRKKAEEALKRNEIFLSTLLNSIPNPVYYKNRKGQYMVFNRAFEKFFGATKEQLIGKTAFEINPPELANIYHEKDNELLVSGGEQRYETQVKNLLGATRDVIFNKAVFTDSKGTISGLIGTMVDITERKQAEDALRESEARLHVITDSANDAIAMMDNNGNISYWNPSAERILGFTAEEAIGKNLHQLIVPERFLPAHLAAFPEFQKTGRGNAIGKTLELVARRKDGTEIDIALSLSAVKIEGEWHAVGIMQDITERKQAEEQIKHLATHDLLTDLPGLRLAMDRLSSAMNMARRYKKAAAVMFIDLDGFKMVNDTLGHDAGDYVLKQVAQRLLSCVRETDTVARVGGDEFLIIATEIISPDNVAQIAQKVIRTISQPIIVNGQQTAVSTSIGISLFPDHGEDMDKLIKLADEAMYKVKNTGKNNFLFVNKSA